MTEAASYSPASWRLFGVANAAAAVAGSYLFGLARLPFVPRDGRDDFFRHLHESAAMRLVERSGRLKGPFMKLIQLLSVQQHAMLPSEYMEALAQLQDDAPAVDYRAVRELVEREIGMPVLKAFREFEREPIAAASLGQVHRARMPDGTKVAVKVQYPEVEEAAAMDLTYFRAALRLIKLTSNVANSPLDFGHLNGEVAEIIHQELDYYREAENIETFRRIYHGDGEVRVPRVYRERSSRRVLTMEMMNGARVKEFAASDADRETRLHVITTLWRMFFHEALLHGVIHADAHPGNYLVSEGGKVVLLDFGCCKKLSFEQRRGLLDFILGGMEGKLDRMGRGFKAMGYVADPSAAAPYLSMSALFLGEMLSDHIRVASKQQEDLLRGVLDKELYRMVPPEQVFLLRKFFGLQGITSEIARPILPEGGKVSMEWRSHFLPIVRQAEQDLFA